MADYPISNVVRRVVYSGSAGLGPYAFTFEVLDDGDVSVYIDSTLKTLTTHYTVTINANGTGEVTFVSGSGPTSSQQVTVVGSRTVERLTDFVTGGDFFANTLNDELDSQTIFIQQIAETAERGLKAPVYDPTDIEMTLPAKADRKGKVLAFDETSGDPVAGPDLSAMTTVIAQSANINTVAASIADVNDVAADLTNIDTVAGSIGNVNTVAGSISNVNTVATNIANVNTVAGISANVTTVATNNANVTTVAGISANVTTVAGIHANVTTVAGVSGDVTTVAGIAADVSAVENIAANVTTVAGVAANVTTVATNNAAVTTVATNITAVNTAATNIAAITSAPTYAANAAASESAATAAQTAAEAARDATLAAYDSFDDRYLGAKASNPSLDNDGNALVAGALYYNTTVPEMRLYTGSAWVAAYVSGAAYLASANNLSDVANTTTARTNLGVAIGSDVQAYSANIPTAAPGTTGNVLTSDGSVWVSSPLAAVAYGLFSKSNPSIVAWSKTGAGTATTSSILRIEVNGSVQTIASGTSITMPTLASGTDYAIWAKTDGTLEATNNHTTPPTANARKVGGFHYAPGGNAANQSGGDTTPAINAYSFWDLKFKPACPDPRGMTLVADSFWSDIYLLNTEHLTNGTSKYNVLMADGSSLPKKPLKFGGNGTTTQASGDWWNMNEVLQSHGKRSPTYDEFAALAYGTTEASSLGSDPVNTVLNAAYTSRWGVIQSTGVVWIWGGEFGGGAAAAGWAANTGGRGSTYQMENAVLFGGFWGLSSSSGSRASSWLGSPTYSDNSVGARGVSDHLILD